jgi:hypothetical protein
MEIMESMENASLFYYPNHTTGGNSGIQRWMQMAT